MTSQGPRIYTYKITFEEVPYYYYGVHKEQKYNEYYMGSPKTHKWCWEFYTPKKQILQFFEFNDEGYLEAQKIEKRIIKPIYNTDKRCLNENCGGKTSLEICRKIGRTHKENGTGIFSLTQEQKIENGRKSGQKTYKNKTGIFSLTEEQRIENGKMSGLKHKENKIGVCGLTLEQRIEAGKKGGKIGGNSNKKNKTGFCGRSKEKMSEDGKKSGKIGGLKTYEMGVGVHSLTKEQLSENGKKIALKHKENGTGIFSLSKEQLSENGKKGGKRGGKIGGPKGGKTTSSQVWECTITGHRTTPGPLTRYQKARNIDTSNRVRIL